MFLIVIVLVVFALIMIAIMLVIMAVFVMAFVLIVPFFVIFMFWNLNHSYRFNHDRLDRHRPMGTDLSGRNSRNCIHDLHAFDDFPEYSIARFPFSGV